MGRSESLFGDMWEFDHTLKVWIDMHPPSSINPGARSNPFMIMLEESQQVLLFGGDTKSALFQIYDYMTLSVVTSISCLISDLH
jgi:hypothetical protein